VLSQWRRSANPHQLLCTSCQQVQRAVSVALRQSKGRTRNALHAMHRTAAGACLLQRQLSSCCGRCRRLCGIRRRICRSCRPCCDTSSRHLQQWVRQVIMARASWHGTSAAIAGALSACRAVTHELRSPMGCVRCVAKRTCEMHCRQRTHARLFSRGLSAVLLGICWALIEFACRSVQHTSRYLHEEQCHTS
jgi:hypothetical protein